MKKQWKGMAVAGLVACVLAAAAVAAPYRGEGRGGRGGGFGRGGGGFFHLQELSGTVSAVNASANSLAVQAQVRGLNVPVTLVVPSTAPITRISNTGISGLKAGDQIQVEGLPLSIQATAIRASSLPASTTTGTTGATTTGATTTGATTTGATTTGATTTGTTAAPRADAEADAVGTVMSVDATKNQVVVTLADGVSVTVNVPAGLQIQRQDQVTLASAQIGDLVDAQVQVDASGNVTAVAVRLMAPAAATTGGTTTTTGATTTGATTTGATTTGATTGTTTTGG